MKILALEMSTRYRTVAAIESGLLVGSIQEDSGKSGTPYRWISQVLGEAGWEREQVEGMLVGVGPGSYTGIRIALSIASGWKLGHGIHIAGAPALELLAWQVWAQGKRGMFGIGLDVGRREWFGALCRVEDPGYVLLGQPERKAAREWMNDTRHVEEWMGPILQNKAPVPERFTAIYPGPEALLAWAQRHPDAFSQSDPIPEPVYARPVEFVKAPKVDLAFLESKPEATESQQK